MKRFKRPRPSLVPNWKKLYKSWTIIFSVLFGLANLVMGGLYLLTPFMSPTTFAVVNFVLYMVVGIGRMLKQDGLEVNMPPSRYTPQPYAQTEEQEEKYSTYNDPDAP